MKQSLRIFLFAVLLSLSYVGGIRAQMLIGASGQLNIPTATARPSATFDVGLRYMSKHSSNGVYNFDTGLYYATFSPFSFLEATFRETLLYTSKTNKAGEVLRGYYQQDRSTSVRLFVWQEKENSWYPSLALGANDFYSYQGQSFYAAFYGVLTKKVSFGILDLEATLGYYHPYRAGKMYQGLFGGVTLAPFANKKMRFLAEYDSKSFNLGADAVLWNSLHIFAYTNDFKGLATGLSYRHTINY